MKKYCFIVFSLILTLNLFAQIPVGNWRTHLSYTNVTQVAETPEKVYGVSDGSLFSYDKSDQSIERYDKLAGLSDTKIKLVSYSPANKSLLIAYENANIDVLTDDGEIFNIPDVKNKSLTLNKTIYGIDFNGKNAYVCTAYGISIVNLLKYEITESYINKVTFSAAVFNGYLYAATVDGVYKGSLSSNLNDFRNWELATDLRATSLLVFQDQLVALEINNGLFTLANNSYEQVYQTNAIRNITLSRDKLIAYGSSEVSIFSSLTSKITSNAASGIVSLSSLNSDQYIWLTRGASLNRLDDSNVVIRPVGPIANSPYVMHFSGDKLMVVGGGATGDRLNTPGIFMSFENEEWANANSDTTLTGIGRVRDFMDVVEDPNEKGHFYVASWGEGLYEYRSIDSDNPEKLRMVKLYNASNSNLETIIAGSPNYIRIGALCYDSNGNLFMTNNEISKVIKVFTKEGNWITLSYPGIATMTSVRAMIRDKRGYFWALNVRSSDSRLFVFDPKTTITNQNDDQSAYFEQFNYYDNSDLKGFTPAKFLSIAEDKKGAIWLGTDIGLIVFNSPSKVFDTDFIGTRIKIPRNDGTDLADYLLDGVSINALAVDGGNRKWLGTESNGVYLVSEDGQQTIHHFTADNSPLLSDKILSIAIHPTTGEVFIGTDKGLISYRSDATTASPKYSDVYAFPNPVRAEYEGLITITGLKYKSTVRITDISGNSIFEGISAGGQITWNGRNRSGEKVASGVYLVYAGTSSGLEGVVTKIMIVR